MDLGPSQMQETYAPCEVEGNCSRPLGAVQVGLIYVNPEGPMGKPDPVGSSEKIRDTFSRMGMNDRETVALIGGGHTYGKSHGACPLGPGLAPNEVDDPETQAWLGECGTGKGMDTFTSGFEGSWTSNPTAWDNEYFHNLVNYEWHKRKGPGGHVQWYIPDGKGPRTPLADGKGGDEGIMMFTSDIALVNDPKYFEVVKEFQQSQAAFDEAFKMAWHKLTTRAFGAQKKPRCVSPSVEDSEPAFLESVCDFPESSEAVADSEDRDSQVTNNEESQEAADQA